MRKLLGTFLTVFFFASGVALAAEYRDVRGTIKADGTGQFFGSASLPNARERLPEQQGDQPNAKLVLRGLGGEAVREIEWAASFSEASGSSPFTWIFEETGSRVASVELFFDGKLIDYFKVSEAGPRLEDVQAQLVDGKLNLQWKFSGTQSGLSSSRVYMSRNQGQSWSMVGLSTTQFNYLIDFTRLPKTMGAMFQVRLSDGYNTAVATVPQRFDIPNKAPRLQILAPRREGETILKGAGLLLIAQATDDSDADISQKITWSSNLDGALGTGNKIVVRSLSVGLHKITCQVEDSEGARADQSIEVNVLPRAE
jgi:hypothetical protein